MVLCKTRQYRLLAGGLLPVGVLALALVYGPAWGAGGGESKPAGSNERLRELMTQRYEILQRDVKNAELMLENGRIDVPTFQDLTAAMYLAQADLCTTPADRVKVYEKRVEVLIAHDEILERQGRAGRLSQIQVDQGKLVTLNAQINLERLRLGQSARPPWSGE
jgi:hypothetical protein